VGGGMWASRGMEEFTAKSAALRRVPINFGA